MSTTAHLSLRGVTLRYPGATVAAIQDVDLELQRGEVMTLLGPSGCGKSTTLRVIAGLETPQSGAVVLEGEDITLSVPEARRMGVVFQSYALFPHLNVGENVAFGLKARRVDRKRIRQAVAETLELVQLGGLEDRDVTTLSGGQQQRVALARALAIEPRVLLLDEPLSNLDAALRDETRDTLRALLARLYITTVFVTHDQLEALAFSDKIALMKDGRIVEVGYPRALYEQPAAEFTARFLGAANLFDGEEQGDGRVMVAGLGGEALEVGSRGTTRTGALRVMVRAEAVSFVEGPGPNTYAGQIIDRVYQGPVTRCLVRVGEHELRVHARRPPAESGVWVHLPADQVHVL